MNVSEVLLASLVPATRSQAESTLVSLSTSQPQFITSLLQLVLNPAQPIQARQAAALYFKNIIKRRWNAEANEEPPIDAAEKKLLREQLVPAMVALASQSKLLRTQIADAVGLVAAVDFPGEWRDLLAQLVSNLSPADYGVNVCILETAHSIFLPWRSQMRSNELYATINFALEQFQDPFFAVFEATASTLLSGQSVSNLELVAQTQTLLASIYLDLTFQDIAPRFEDSVPAFFGAEGVDPTNGYFLRFLQWNPTQLQGDADNPTPSEPMQLKTTILETCEVFTFKYNELFSSRVAAFIRAVWELIGSSTEAVREDQMVAQAIRFLSVTAKSGLHTDLFSQQATLEGIAQRIIVPSVPLREHEVEQFEDDPLEYIRRDLSSSTEGGSTRRHAASELIRALVHIGLDAPVTHLIQNYIDLALQNYKQNPSENWRSKDTAIYLLTAIAAQTSTTQHGVTSTNMLVDIIKFFSDNIAQDLSADPSTVHPILQVDAIKFLYTFRYQLTKEQLGSVLPLLIRHLESPNYVCYTYAAITIERVLFMKQGKTPLFTHADIESYAGAILTTLFTRVRSGGTPEKVAENEYLMKCVMRVIITARQTLAAGYTPILSNLVEILGIISKNPSNPQFTQYTFESISALLRFVSAADAASITQFEATLFGPFTVILQQDIDQFIPYVFQILSQMLEAHTATLPDAYRSLLPLLLTPPPWTQRGNIPALVRLTNAFLSKDASRMESEGQLKTVIAIVQSRLIPSKLNDQYGFELIQTIVRTVPAATLQNQYFVAIVTALFTRLQTSKTERFTYSLMHLFFYAMSLNVPGMGPEFVVSEVEKVQPGIWTQLFNGVIIGEVSKTRRHDIKVVLVGLTRLLTESHLMRSPQNRATWEKGLAAVRGLLREKDVVSQDVEDDDPDAALTAIDYEEQTAGYQAAFSKLAASQAKSVDPLAHISDARAFAKQTLSAAFPEDATVLQAVQ